ncbi:MAG: hypothetical protein ACQERM_09545, partial [Methanobacteriota archaeon]
TLRLNTSERGPSPVTFNTYASPSSPSEFVATGSGVSVESVTGPTGPLSPGTYDLTLRSEHGTEVANDTATVTVDPRSTDNLTAYTTREVSSDGFENATAIREAIDDGTLTPEPNATANETVVYAVNATGLTGLPATANTSLDRGEDLNRLDGFSFGVAPTETGDDNETVDGDALGATPNESAVHLDREGLYLVADGERAFGTETDLNPGETFEAAFRVDDDRLRRTAADSRHRVTTELAYAAPDSIDGGTENETTDGSTETPTADGNTTDTDDSSDSEISDSSGTSTGGGSTGGSGSAGSSGSAGGGGSTGGSAGSEGAADSPGSAGADTSTGAGGPSSVGGPSGSDANLSGPRPGVGISIAPGMSEILPSAGPPELFDTDRSERGAGGSAVGESRSVGAQSDDAGGEGDDAPSDESADSSATSESGDSSAPDDSSAPSGQSTDEADVSDLGYDNAPIRSTAYDLPGFGPIASLAAVAAASLLARRRGPGS